jgi:hypothetical protein
LGLGIGHRRHWHIYLVCGYGACPRNAVPLDAGFTFSRGDGHPTTCLWNYTLAHYALYLNRDEIPSG